MSEKTEDAVTEKSTKPSIADELLAAAKQLDVAATIEASHWKSRGVKDAKAGPMRRQAAMLREFVDEHHNPDEPRVYPVRTCPTCKSFEPCYVLQILAKCYLPGRAS